MQTKSPGVIKLLVFSLRVYHTLRRQLQKLYMVLGLSMRLETGTLRCCATFALLLNDLMHTVEGCLVHGVYGSSV